MCIVYDIFNFAKLGCDLCLRWRTATRARAAWPMLDQPWQALLLQVGPAGRRGVIQPARTASQGPYGRFPL